MKKKKDEVQIERIKGKAQLLLTVLYSINKGVDLETFLKQNNSYFSDPKNDDGAIIDLSVKEVILDKQAILKQTQPSQIDKLDLYIHFKFRGVNFCVNRETNKVISSTPAFSFEMHSDQKDKNGYFDLNTETSD